MKRSHIIAIAVIAVAIGALMSSLFDSSTYADLQEAFERPGKEFHVVGTLDRSNEIIYEPTANPNLTKFVIEDLNGKKCDVHLLMAKPADIERSERIVLIGTAQADGTFEAHDMLMKCPSKYNEENMIRASEA
jgi:cytochrome c-type biogenesis protein CcmE